MKVFVAADNIVSPLGFSSANNFEKLKNNISGIKLVEDSNISSTPFHASVIDTYQLNNLFENVSIPFTRLEKMFIASIDEILKNAQIDTRRKDTLFILCTTKGNIDLQESRNKNKFEPKRTYLWEMANVISTYYQNPNAPIVISNACISGSLGIITASRLLQSSRYKNIIVSGADIVSEFTVAGFHAFKAISPVPCKPFDRDRNGITLGEGCGTMLLSADPKLMNDNSILVAGGATSNDANHISGPSRTGDGLFIAIKNALKEAKISATEIEHISAHGTATIYNDEMEAKAISLAGLEESYVNSLKGYFGHTLGAAGMIESIIATHSLKENTMINTLGFEKLGVSEKINVVNKLTRKTLKNCLKTGSGFGGCNAALIFKKND